VDCAGPAGRRAGGPDAGLDVGRIFLSVPHMSGHEQEHVREAFASNWLSTVGPHVDALEREAEARLGCPVAAVASATAAIHLGLRLLGVGASDEVFCSTLTFVASANPILYLGGRPVFIDSNRPTWNMDPELLASALRRRYERGRLPRAVVVVHLFGQCADMTPIMEICRAYGVPVVEDAAESLGATYRGRPAGTFGDVGAFSLNGNKIITGSGGGLLVGRDRRSVERVKYWAAQAREPGVEFHHRDVGYNYAMSNVVAGIARGQLQVLEERVRQRRALAHAYQEAFADVEGITLMPQCDYGVPTHWLSAFLIDERRFGATRDDLLHALLMADIEARPVWKPLHLQPIFSGAEVVGGAIAEDLHRRGICLPSSSCLSPTDQGRVVDVVRSVSRSGCRRSAAICVCH
jgi:pyridoxal phosphate-dependent aminotransferase EpsN